MKKLKLKLPDLGATEVLTRSQLKNVLAGDDAGTGTKQKKCKIVCATHLNGNLFTWSGYGDNCSTIADCKNIECSTANGPITSYAITCI